ICETKVFFQHTLFTHSAFFLDTYGSLGIWSTKGWSAHTIKQKQCILKIHDMEVEEKTAMPFTRFSIGSPDF
ncbi:hypothetical protein DD594_27005, partial [Enterobacter cloacae complex sp. 4DZ1-17B1]|uniref:hypothetical protein n=1 Tax=Enterobacter cloacae complex sp. 4DZ1-17B1 TaxID=2511991 RepID=UPI001026CA72